MSWATSNIFGRRKLITTLGVFLIALPVRVLGLGVFQTFDEDVIWYYSHLFFQAVYHGKLADTAPSTYPGVVFMWLQSIAVEGRYLVLSLVNGSTSPIHWLDLYGSHPPLSVLAEKRLVVGVTTALLVMGIWWLVERLCDQRVAGVAAILLAFDPFWLTDSRVVRVEGMTTGLMSIAFLGLLVYLKEGNRRFLFLSSIFAGLAVANKATALILVLYGTFLILIASFSHCRSGDGVAVSLGLRRVVVVVSVWVGGAILVIWLIWPAMWVAPLHAIGTVVQYLAEANSDFRTTVAGGQYFFNGQVLTHAPDATFYPIALAFRSTPWVWLGGLAALFAAASDLKKYWTRKGEEKSDLDFWSVLALIAFVPFFLVFIDRGFSKYDRYVMPVFPLLDIIAAWGLVRIVRLLQTAIRRENYKRWVYLSFLSVVFLTSIVTAIVHYPYYYTYYNPLLGGIKRAQDILPVGAGEGVDIAMNHLNQQPDARKLVVVCGLTANCGANFVGEVLPHDTLKNGEWLRADYVFFYLYDLKRQVYPSDVVDFVRQHWALEEVVQLQGIDYGWLYRKPSNVVWSGSVLEGKARLLAVEMPPSSAIVEDDVEIKILWQNRGLKETDALYVLLVDSEGYPWQKIDIPFHADGTGRDVIESLLAVPLVDGMPIGDYWPRFEVGDGTNGELIGQFTTDPERTRLTVGASALDKTRERDMAPGYRTGTQRQVDFPLRLLGFDSRSGLTLYANEENWLAFHWEVEELSSADYYDLRLDLMEPSSYRVVVTWMNRLVLSRYVLDEDAKAEKIINPWKLRVARRTEPRHLSSSTDCFGGGTAWRCHNVV